MVKKIKKGKLTQKDLLERKKQVKEKFNQTVQRIKQLSQSAEQLKGQYVLLESLTKDTTGKTNNQS